MKCEIGVLLPTIGSWFREHAPGTPLFSEIKQMAVIAEDMGFNSFWVPDHLLNPPLGPNAGILESWITLAALAMVTRRMKFGHTANCNGFRHPALIAKMGATLDEISNGRFILAMGAGSYLPEFKEFDFPFEEHEDRIAKVVEAVRIIRSLWTQQVTSFEGEYYHLSKAHLEPKPVQQPSPPIWIAGSSNTTKRAVVLYGDGWLTSDQSPDQLRDAYQSLLKEREDGKDIDLSVMKMVIVQKNTDDVKRLIKPILESRNMRLEEFAAKNIIGTPEECVHKLRAYSDAGVTHLILQFTPPYEAMTLFGETVLPLL